MSLAQEITVEIKNKNGIRLISIKNDKDVITLKTKMSLEDARFLGDYYKKNYKKLKKEKKETLSVSPTLSQDNSNQKEPEQFYTYSSLSKYASYEKITKLLKQGLLTEGVHFVILDEKRLWTEEAVKELKNRFVLTEKEKQDFYSLYMWFTDEKGMSLNKLSKEIAKRTEKSERGAYAFFYTLFSKKLNKKSVKIYKTALEELKEEIMDKENA